MASLLTNLFGCSNPNKNKVVPSNIFPEESFAVIESNLEDGIPVVGSFNLGYKNYKLKTKYTWCLKIGIALDQDKLFENGLPLPEESQIANSMEDEFIEKISELTTAHYIGHLFNDEFLDIYWYLDKPENVNKWLQTQINKEDLKRGFGYEINPDANWETVKQFLDE